MYQFVRLNPTIDLSNFSCESQDLNEFLQKDAWEHQVELIAVTYLWLKDNDIVAYTSISNDSIVVRSNRQKRNIRKYISHSLYYDTYPAVKIGRLAVDERYKNQGEGTDIVNYIKKLFITDNRTGCRFITVDALEGAVGFYQKNGFKEFPLFDDENKREDTVLMYYDLKTLPVQKIKQ